MYDKVCMFVWNYFTNDARVQREATALTEAGYKVKVVCIHDSFHKSMPKEEIMNGFQIKRVKRYTKFYVKSNRNLKKIKQTLKDNKILLMLTIPILIFLSPVYFILKLMKKIGLFKGYNVFCIFLRMIREGFTEEFDIYHSNDLNTLPQGYICKSFRRKKLIYDSHEVQTSRTGYIGKKYYYLEKYLIKRIDKMIMTTDTRSDYNAKLYNIEKPEVIHNYPFIVKPNKSEKDLYEIANIPREEPILLYQGGIQQGRGIEKIVEAIPKFERGITVFIGDGRLKTKIENMVKEKELNNKVRFISKVPAVDLMKYTQHAYLGFQVLQNICFNHYSSLSNKLLEYIMMEVPVVSSNFPEMKNVVEGECVGITIEPNNSNNIADAVNYLLNNNDKYEEFKKNCKKALKKYNWDSEKYKFVRIYDELLGK